jgi:hypothetical protein
MDIQLKVLKRKSKSASSYAQTVTEKKQQNNKIGTHTNKRKEVNDGKSNKHGKRYFEFKTRGIRTKGYTTRNIK